VLYRKRELARRRHEHGVFACFRYNDLKEAACGCGGCGPYANSKVGQRGVEVRGDCAAARHTRPHARISWLPRKSISKSVVEEAEKRDLFDGKA
jgi:hypothetical protein